MIKKNLENMLVSEAVLPRISYNWKKKVFMKKPCTRCNLTDV